MDIFRISGGNPLHGKVKVSGSKNSALPLFAASLLTEEETILDNVPDLSDVNFMAEILAEHGSLFISALEKANKTNIVHKNKISRKKSRCAELLSNL